MSFIGLLSLNHVADVLGKAYARKVVLDLPSDVFTD